MVNKTDETLVFLTYNDKFLLMLKDNRLQVSDLNLWHLIGGLRKNNESFEQTSIREVGKVTSLELDSVQYLTTLLDDKKRNFVFHAILTAHHLNNIHRAEGQNLDFFTLPEIEKLSLEKSTEMFLSHNRKTIQGILHT